MADTPVDTALAKRVTALEKKVAEPDPEFAYVRDRLEDVLDHIFGTNVRPPLKSRTEDEYAAEVDYGDSEEK